MPERKPSLFILDMIRCIEHISSYTKDMTFETFSVNFLVIEACLYNIQIIGEAV